MGKESACNEGNLGSIPGLGIFPGGGHDNPLQCFLENPNGQRHALITWLSCTDHVADHAMIT